MRFLVDRCAGRQLAEWLGDRGHDVVESRNLGPDPGDESLLQRAAEEHRILVTIDTDFGVLVFVRGAPHSGVVRLPDVPAARRIALFEELLAHYAEDLESGAIITVRGNRIRVSRTPRE